MPFGKYVTGASVGGVVGVKLQAAEGWQTPLKEMWGGKRIGKQI
jgi:hypothetical protein